MGKYEDLKLLEELRAKGTISEEEFQQEKKKILDSGNGKDLWGINKQSYLTLMHFSQLAGWIFPLLGFALPIFMWISGKEDKEIDQHGKNILNFMLSWLFYMFLAGLLSFFLVGIPILVGLFILQVIFIIKGALKANRGEYWKYPFSFQLFS